METYRNKAVASMVLGIISLCVAWFGFSAIAGLVCAIIGLVFAIQIRKAAELEGFVADKFTTAGFVLGIIGIVINAAVFISCLACIGVAGASSFGALSSIAKNGFWW